MDLEVETRKNTEATHQLTVTVTRLATLLESHEKLRVLDAEMIKRAVEGISALGERMNSTIGMEKDIASIKEKLAEKNDDIRTIRNDIDKLLSTAQAIAALTDDSNENAKAIVDIEGRLKTLEAWHDKVDGGAAAVKYIAYVFWTVFGSAILGALYYVARMYFTGVGVAGE